MQPSPVKQGGTGATTPLGARKTLGLLGAGTQTKAAAYTIAAADAGTTFLFGAAVTLTLPAVSAVGDGFVVAVSSPRSANVVGTLAANGSDAIDAGLASLRVVPGQSFLVVSDGTQWRTFGRSSRVALGKTTLTSGSSLVLPLPAGFDEFEVDYSFTSTTSAQLAFVLSFDGGQTYVTAANSYVNAGLDQNGNSAAAYVGTGASAALNASQASAQYYGSRGRLRLCPGVPSSFVTAWDGICGQYSSTINLLAFSGYNTNTSRPTHMMLSPTAGTFAYLDVATYGLVTQ